ncbi:hypothetical protein Sjap_010474 [Stephania japonica]|uniref:Uncharacterized protein n=1 Tax=Stephania japonica TaxID=461633 RepID=A0AAP0J966_9MAGN
MNTKITNRNLILLYRFNSSPNPRLPNPPPLPDPTLPIRMLPQPQPQPNVTGDSILLILPANCSGHPIHTLGDLYDRTFAPSDQNGLLLGGCHNSSLPLRCAIPLRLLESHLGLRTCNPNLLRNVSCYANEYGRAENRFLSLDTVKNRSGCESVLSAFAFDAAENESRVSIEFETVRLEWWIEGACGERSCDANALCVNVTSPSRGAGFRCKCDRGYEGDGFAAAQGCRKGQLRWLDFAEFLPAVVLRGTCLEDVEELRELVFSLEVHSLILPPLLLKFFGRMGYAASRLSRPHGSQKCNRRLLSEAIKHCTVPFYTYKEIERATSSFSEKHRLGTGAYGTVYAGKFHNDEWVAIKKIRNRDSDGFEQVINEIKLLSSVSHPNLVRLLGCCIERGEQILVYEFMPNGTLAQHLQRERGTGLPWYFRLTIATETAQAIAHLHSAKNPPIYHRDIKSSNILLDYSFKSKVADFGLSRFGLTEFFGVVLVEIITALKVVDFSRAHTEVNLAALAVDKIGKGCIDQIIDPFLESHMDGCILSSVHKVAELAFRCLAFHKDMRPSMMEVAAELECIRRNVSAEENLSMRSSSVSSSPSNGSEKLRGFLVKKGGVDSRRLVVPQRSKCPVLLDEVKDNSPSSVQDPWFSEQSSPSTNSLLDNVIN